MATIKDVNLDKPVEIYPSKTVGITSTPFDFPAYVLPPALGKSFVSELAKSGRLALIEETLQGLAQRTDGTLLKTAFPSLSQFKSSIKGLSSLPTDLLSKLNQWESMGATEINLDFEQLIQNRH